MRKCLPAALAVFLLAAVPPACAFLPTASVRPLHLVAPSRVSALRCRATSDEHMSPVPVGPVSRRTTVVGAAALVLAAGRVDAKTTLTAEEIHNRQVRACCVDRVLPLGFFSICPLLHTVFLLNAPTARSMARVARVPTCRARSREVTLYQPLPRVQWDLNRANFRAQWLCDMVWYARRQKKSQKISALFTYVR
jgi:hypothetical protein